MTEYKTIGFQNDFECRHSGKQVKKIMQYGGKMFGKIFEILKPEQKKTVLNIIELMDLTEEIDLWDS